MYFFLSLGSNIEAEQSAVHMLHHLCARFGCIGAYPFRYTEPEGMDSDTMFLNSLVILRSKLTRQEVKSQLNGIEELMGRDRSNPLRSLLNRRADIDILGESEYLDLQVFTRAKEPYVAACFRGLGGSPDLSNLGLAPHQRPASIYLDAVTRNIVVVEDEFKRFENGLEAAFER